MAARAKETTKYSPSEMDEISEANSDITRLHSQMIQALSNEIAPEVENSWNEFKSILGPHLSLVQLARCNDMFDIVQKLLNRGKISYGEYKILSNAFGDRHNPLTSKMLYKYERLIIQKQKEQPQKELLTVNLEKKVENLHKKLNEEVKQRTAESVRQTVVQSGAIEMEAKQLREKLQSLQAQLEKSKTDPSEIMNKCMENIKGVVMEMSQHLQNNNEDIHSAFNHMAARQDMVMEKIELLENKTQDLYMASGLSETNTEIMAKLQGRDLKNLRLHDIIVFDSIIINIGSAYDSNTGVFRCPEKVSPRK